MLFLLIHIESVLGPSYDTSGKSTITVFPHDAILDQIACNRSRIPGAAISSITPWICASLSGLSTGGVVGDHRWSCGLSRNTLLPIDTHRLLSGGESLTLSSSEAE